MDIQLKPRLGRVGGKTLSTVNDWEESEVPAQLGDYILHTVTMDTDKHINLHVLTGRPLIIIRGPNDNTIRGDPAIAPYCQAAKVSATLPLPFWTYYMSWAHSITKSCTCVNNTSCNQLKVFQELEVPAPRVKEWQREVGTLDLLAVCHNPRHETYASSLRIAPSSDPNGWRTHIRMNRNTSYFQACFEVIRICTHTHTNGSIA